jgi:predicted amino acid dehydrogenase
MKAFAFLEHPLTIAQLKTYNPLIRIIPDFMVGSSLRKTPSFKISKLKKVHSSQGKEIQGYFISWPILTKQLLELKEEFILDKVIECCQIAEELGAGILGLGGYISMVADRGYQAIAKNLKIPVTTGSVLNAWSVFEAIYRMSRVKNIDLKKSTLAVIGLDSSVGSLCARKLSAYVSKIIITAGQRDRLEQLKESILNLSPIEVIIEEDMHKAVQDADIVINATNVAEILLDIEKLRLNTIICDVSVSGNITLKRNPGRGITIIRGGLIKIPLTAKLGVYTASPRNIIYAGLAETMLLAFAEKFVSYSLGDNVNLDKLEEIADIAVQNGFEVWVPEAPVV